MMKDPAMLKGAAEMMKAMGPEHLQAAMAQVGGPRAAMSPAQLAQMTDQLASLPPEQLQAAISSNTAAAAAAAGSGSSSSLPPSMRAAAGGVSAANTMAAGAPPGMPDVSAMMQNPAMMKMAVDMMSNMKPEDMAAMQQAMASGGDPTAAGVCWPELLVRSCAGLGWRAGGLTPPRRRPCCRCSAGLSGMSMSPALLESMMTSMQSMDEGSLKQVGVVVAAGSLRVGSRRRCVGEQG
jgi:hypothetical protein